MLSRLALHPLLFAAYAVLFLYSVNLAEVLPVDAVVPLGEAVIGAAAVWAIASAALRDARRGAVAASGLTVAFYAFGHVATLVGPAVDERALLGAAGALVLGVTAYAVRARDSLPRATSALNVLSVTLVVLAAATIVPYEIGRAARGVTPSVAGTDVTGVSPGPDRDIYFLVFDRYGSEESLELRFGITDNDLPSWLAGRGFQVAERAHANYRATDMSLASTLNMTFLDELTEQVGRVSSDRTPARALLREHAVGRFLRERGYAYRHLGSWYGPTLDNDIADDVFSYGVDTEFASVLGDTTAMPAIERLAGVVRPDLTFRDRHSEIAHFQFAHLARLAAAPGRDFVFAHVLLPHAPYVFRADGSIIPEDESRASDEGVLYAGQLRYTNGLIKATVERLLSGPDETDPIVIVQADEGPFLCRNVDCPATDADGYRIRFGILSAMYLPGLPPDTVYGSMTSVNTFRMLFREYFGADLPPLPDRSFTWPDNEHLYDFRDITDQLGVP